MNRSTDGESLLVAVNDRRILFSHSAEDGHRSKPSGHAAPNNRNEPERFPLVDRTLPPSVRSTETSPSAVATPPACQDPSLSPSPVLQLKSQSRGMNKTAPTPNPTTKQQPTTTGCHVRLPFGCTFLRFWSGILRSVHRIRRANSRRPVHPMSRRRHDAPNLKGREHADVSQAT